MQLLSNRVKFSSWTVGLILFLLSAAPLSAEDQATTGSAKSLAAAETAFAQESVENGMRSAFLQVLSDDSIVFLPGPQNGKKAWESKPASEEVLQWHPVLAATSTNGDLGYTTGPWTFQEEPCEQGTHRFRTLRLHLAVGKWEMEITLRSRLGSSAASGRAQPGAATGGKPRPSRIARHRSAVHAGPRSQLRLGPRPAFFLGRRGFDPSLSAAGISLDRPGSGRCRVGWRSKTNHIRRTQRRGFTRRRFGICLG